MAGPKRGGGTADMGTGPIDPDILRDRIAMVLLEAFSFVPPGRVRDTVRSWTDRMDRSVLPAAQEAALMADAVMMASTLAVFTQSASGAVAVDRLARARTPLEPVDAAAIGVLRQARFRLLTLLDAGADGTVRLRDMASGQVIALHGPFGAAVPAGVPAGLHLVAWLGPAPAGGFICASAVTPLDDAALAVAKGFLRAGQPALVNPVRCAEGVYRHVLRHGTLRIPGLNEPLPGHGDGFEEQGNDLDTIALDWAQPGAQRDPEDVWFVRAETRLDSVLAMLASAANTRAHGLPDLSAAYTAIVLIQLETLQRRAAIGSGSLRIEAVAAALATNIAAGEILAVARTIFDTLRRQLGPASSAGRRPDAELDKLIGRIQALRAKTVEHGCTEQEALTAAEKVAELLDRYGLSLSELDLRQQACEGLAVETSRKRTGPLDDCVPAVAAFFDCRAWGEKNAAGLLRYVFFGLPADVAAARYLYELVDQAFGREAALFKAGETYAQMPGRLRRTATNSFQIGLGRGITARLHAIRAERETALRGSSGRDLVVVKADVIEMELSGLGLNFRARSRPGGRRVLSEAFDEGHTAGLGFSYTPGIGAKG